MNDQKLECEVEAIENQYVVDKKSFTAVDIGNELKRKGINVRQREVSPIVREHFKGGLYNGSGYTRTLIPVKDGSVKAYVYFHIDNEPKDYLEINQEILSWDPNKPMFSDEGDLDAGNGLDDLVDDSSLLINSHSALDNYVASKKSEVYHHPDCMYAVRISKDNVVSFSDTKEAIKEGYRKCMRE